MIASIYNHRKRQFSGVGLQFQAEDLPALSGLCGTFGAIPRSRCRLGFACLALEWIHFMVTGLHVCNRDAEIGLGRASSQLRMF